MQKGLGKTGSVPCRVVWPLGKSWSAPAEVLVCLIDCPLRAVTTLDQSANLFKVGEVRAAVL